MVRKIRYLNKDMCKFESSQKDESRWQSTDSSKAYRNTSAFKCLWWSMCAMVHCNYARQTKEQWGLCKDNLKWICLSKCFSNFFHRGTLINSGFGHGTPILWWRKPTATWTKHFISILSKHETFAAHFNLFRGTLMCRGTQFGKSWLMLSRSRKN